MAQLQKLEACYNYRKLAPADDSWYEVSSGSIPVLVSAPHACMHRRDKLGKMEEEFTGAIAQYLSDTAKCHSISTVYQSPEDPNWHTDSEYKRAIAGLHRQYNFKLVIDLHGMLNRHQMGVAVGTIRNQSCDAKEIVPAFTRAGFIVAQATESKSKNSDDVNWRKLVVDHPRFTGGVRNHTVTRFVSEQLGIPAVQIELASVARVVYSPPTDDWPQSYSGDEAAIAASVHALQGLVEMHACGPC